MKYYLAARYSRAEEMRGYAAQLEALGHVVTSRWIHGHGDRPDMHLAWEDLADLVGAEMLIFFSDEPDAKTRGRGGRHVEFGIAVGRAMPILIVGRRENVFHHLPAMHQVDTWEEALRRFLGPAGPRCEVCGEAAMAPGESGFLTVCQSCADPKTPCPSCGGKRDEAGVCGACDD
jgi:hypothetical protein